MLSGHVRKVIFVFQVLATVLFPLASPGQAAPVAGAHPQSAAVAHADHPLLSDQQSPNDVSATHRDEALQVQSRAPDPSDCCCDGPAGMCLTLIALEPAMPACPGFSRIKPSEMTILTGLDPALLPHPPKS